MIKNILKTKNPYIAKKPYNNRTGNLPLVQIPVESRYLRVKQQAPLANDLYL